MKLIKFIGLACAASLILVSISSYAASSPETLGASLIIGPINPIKYPKAKFAVITVDIKGSHLSNCNISECSKNIYLANNGGQIAITHKFKYGANMAYFDIDLQFNFEESGIGIFKKLTVDSSCYNVKPKDVVTSGTYVNVDLKEPDFPRGINQTQIYNLRYDATNERLSCWGWD